MGPLLVDAGNTVGTLEKEMTVCRLNRVVTYKDTLTPKKRAWKFYQEILTSQHSVTTVPESSKSSSGLPRNLHTYGTHTHVHTQTHTHTN